MTNDHGTMRTVGTREGREPWADAAFDVLQGVAATYGRTITYSSLAAEVQQRSGLLTTASMRNWIGSVLEVVLRRCEDEGPPALTSLVVHKSDGMVGVGYDAVLRAQGIEPPETVRGREEHAAQARLDCYRRFCDEVPEDAEPMLTDIYRATVDRENKRANPPAPAKVCPNCFIGLPLTGACESCD